MTTDKEAVRVDAWQPIETAPKDGTRVLLHYVHKNFTKIGAWDAGCRYWSADQWFHERPPTHWMPLPAPLATQGGEGERT